MMIPDLVEKSGFSDKWWTINYYNKKTNTTSQFDDPLELLLALEEDTGVSGFE